MSMRARMLLLVLTAIVSCAFVPAAQAVTETLSYTGAVQTWTVPDGVRQVTFDLYGAQGGGANNSAGFQGGLGGEAKMTVDVTEGQTFSVYVGGEAPTLPGSSGPGGFNGGGAGAGTAWGGGGATDVRTGGTSLSDRILVAGGGGGAGGCASQGSTGSLGGAGGGLTGGDGVQSCAGSPGHGASQLDGGAGTFDGGAKGSLGQGGAGGTSGPLHSHGSGGGGGYYGGGGGGDGGPGGGGSGYPSTATFTTGVQHHDGQVIITYVDKVLTVTPTGTGSGYVDSSPTGVDCGRNVTGHTVCDPNYDRGTTVTLTAHPDDTSSIFDGFTGDCVSQTATTCTVQMDAARNVTASFTLKTRQLTLATDGTGGGAIERDPDLPECTSNRPADPTCTPGYPHGTLVLLVAHHHDNSTFAGWSGGACSGRVSACWVTMDADKHVTATFDIKRHPLSVTTDGTGSGYVDSSPSGVDCGRNVTGHTDCDETYDDGTQVTLTAHPGANNTFTGFSGAGCSGTSATCTVTMSEARSVTASFAADTTPPVTSITPTDVHNGWARGLSVTATDAGGVAQTKCWIDPATAPAAFGDGGSVACPSTLPDGTHEVYAASKDNAGNEETPVHATVKIDTNAPVLHLPSPFAVDATRPSGADVPFTATATDSASGPASQAATCSPANGAAFPIGDTTVSCSASDVAGNSASGQFSVHVRGAGEQLAALLTATQALQPRQASLEALLTDAQTAPQRACGDLVLYRTIAGFAAQVGQAPGALRDAADRIRAVLGCSASAATLTVTPPGEDTAIQASTTGAGLPAAVVDEVSAVTGRNGARLTVTARPSSGSATIAATAKAKGARKAKARIGLQVKKAKKHKAAKKHKKAKKAKHKKRRPRRR